MIGEVLQDVPRVGRLELTLLSATIRLMVFSQFSGLARRYEMRDIRLLSSVLWQLPHFDRTSSL